MVHISGVYTAKDIWKQLTTVKELKGRAGIISVRRTLYKTDAKDDTNLVEHIAGLRKLQEELYNMGSIVTDEDFALILLSSMPENWDQFTSSFLGSKTDKTAMLSSHELTAIILDEERRRKRRTIESETAMRAKFTAGPKSDVKCFNCNKKGHMKADCWSKGGGKEGQGPKRGKGGGSRGKSNQAQENVNETLKDVSYMARTEDTISKSDWVLDSGTTSHICPNRDTFASIEPMNGTIGGVGTQPAKVLGRGAVILKFKLNKGTIRHTLANVLYVPDAPNCLLSVRRIDESGGHVVFRQGGCTLYHKGGGIIGTGKLQGSLYNLDAEVLQDTEKSNLAAHTKLSWDEWHRRYGHIGMTSLETLAKGKLVKGLEIDNESKPSPTCVYCIQAKQSRRPYPKEAEHRSSIQGERTLSDVWGPARIESIDKKKYYISFTDDCCRICAVLFMSNKTEANDLIKQYVKLLEVRFGEGKVKYLRFDNGKELINTDLKRWAATKGIMVEATAPYSPSQNGIAERFNRTLLELARAMLFESGLPTFLWTEAVKHAAYIRNRSPTRALDGKTPIEAWTGEKPDVSHFRAFGNDVWILVEGDRSKLEPKSAKYRFVGFEDGSKAVRYYDEAKRSIKVSRNFMWNENDKPMNPATAMNLPGLLREGEKEKIAEQTPEPNTPPAPNQLEIVAPIIPSVPIVRESRTRTNIDYKIMSNPQARKPAPRDADGNRPATSAKRSDPQEERAHIARAFFAGMSGDVDRDPENLQEAMSSQDAHEWSKAIQEELNQLKEMGVYELANLPDGKTAIGCRWKLKRKRDENGIVVRFKARLVAQGYSQKPGDDFTETFAPVMRFETLRTLLAVAAINDWEIHQMDVKGAYLNGRIREELCMKQPPGFDDGTGRYWKLNHPIYGLKQAGNEWNKDYNATMRGFTYQRLLCDYCVHIKRQDDLFVILISWIDDIIAISNSSKFLKESEEELRKIYEMKVLETPELLLGIHVQRNRKERIITLTQTHYIDSIVEKFGMKDAKPVSTPLDPNVVLKEIHPDDPVNEKSSRLFAQAVGSLMYATIATRPDIAHAVNALAQFTRNPQPSHWTAIKRVFRYLKGTRTHGIIYDASEGESINVSAYCDADWASSLHRKSISGYVFTVAGGAIAWSSKKQGTVALSTAEAEYVAATHAAKHCIWQQTLYQELKFPQPETMILHCDNQAAIAISENPEFHSRTKHIDIALHFLRDLTESGKIQLQYIPSRENLADIFTKALARPLFEDLRSQLGVLPVQGGVL
jgi:transposase InsO family protein